ncbi:hypothetical protein COUCH_24485 [Couchioplanes caeruleus]|uniref:hypothetical protein n=1 Tax=Couchioplanes caeruleus TaxID=56438 RepID=UPI0020BFED9C|nr:hypothetical protein [Couchioplanes caeruleus]UQU62191.1 hypothetical protein COUCH_24485 [Couchioplanes caeruleus]
MVALRLALAGRAVYGCALLLMPDTVLRATGRPPTPGAVAVARVLGARHVLQAVVTAAAPGGPVAALGAVVDTVHAAGDLAVAAVAPRWRRPALTDSVIAAGLAAAGWADARRPR